MTTTDFVRELCKLARQRERAVIAIHFEPSSDGSAIQLTFHFKDDDGR